MSQTNPRLRFLFGRFIAGQCDHRELSEFWQLLHGSEKTDPVRKELEELWGKEPAQPGVEKDWDALFSRIRDTISEEEADSCAISPESRGKGKWWLAAAIIFLLAGAGWYLHVSRDPGSAVATATPRQVDDVPPGGNKAMLTLANGSRIALDDLVDGQLAVQGNMRIVKVNNGQLEYQKTDGTRADVAYNTLETPRGGQFQLGLPDGTKVWLNAASSIRYPTVFTGKERKVEITGEVYFEVAELYSSGHGKKGKEKMPFVVGVRNDTEIRVLGTHFNINAYADEAGINTTLLEGAVEVKHATEQLLLKPGQQAQISLNSDLKKAAAVNGIKVLPNADINLVMAWKEGVFNFHHASLEDIMRQVSRWYDIDITYENGVPDMEFGGKMGRDVSLAKLLYFFKGSGVHFRIENEGKKLVVIR